MHEDVGILSEIVNRRVQLLSILIALIGVGLLFASTPVGNAQYHKSAALLEESGAALFIAGVLAVVWELAGKRAFANEILAKANMARDLADAGIDTVVDSFRDPRVNWNDLFKNACRLDIYVAYGATWRSTQLEPIEKLLSDKEGKLRIVLPDPGDDFVIETLAKRFTMSTADITRTIHEARTFFQHRKDAAKGTVEIYLSKIIPVFTFYRFNNKAVLALYNHRLGKLPVPTIVCDEEGFLFDYITQEFEGILGDERTRRVDEEKSTANPERIQPNHP